MIDRAVAVEDVDPDAFAHVNAVLSRRDRSTESSVTVVLDDVGTLTDVEGLCAQHGAEPGDGLVLLDRSGLDDLSARFVELAKQTDDQGLLLARCRQAYLDHPAVTRLSPLPALGPAAPTIGWAEVQSLLDGIPDGEWIEVVAGDWVLAAEIQNGSIVRITSRPPGEATRALRVQGSVDDLDAVLSAANPLGELRARAAAGLVRIEEQGRVQWPA